MYLSEWRRLSGSWMVGGIRADRVTGCTRVSREWGPVDGEKGAEGSRGDGKWGVGWEISGTRESFLMPERPGLHHQGGAEGRAEGSWRGQELRGRKEWEGLSRASIGKAAFLSKPHTSNSQFRSSSGLLQGRPDRKGGADPHTPGSAACAMGAPSTAETTAVSLSWRCRVMLGGRVMETSQRAGARRIPWKVA